MTLSRKAKRTHNCKFRNTLRATEVSLLQGPRHIHSQLCRLSLISWICSPNTLDIWILLFYQERLLIVQKAGKSLSHIFTYTFIHIYTKTCISVCLSSFFYPFFLFLPTQLQLTHSSSIKQWKNFKCRSRKAYALIRSGNKVEGGRWDLCRQVMTTLGGSFLQRLSFVWAGRPFASTLMTFPIQVSFIV